MPSMLDEAIQLLNDTLLCGDAAEKVLLLLLHRFCLLTLSLEVPYLAEPEVSYSE